MKKNSKVLLLILFLGIFSSASVVAEQLYSPEWGYFLDLPEGFNLTSSQDGARFQFDHSMLPITLAIASYGLDRYETASDALDTVYENLQLQGETVTVSWRDSDNAIGTFTMGSGEASFSGWASAIVLPEEKGITVFLCYSPSQLFSQSELIIVSTLDSIDLMDGSILETGILTHYAYPPEGDKPISITIEGKEIQSVIDSIDVEASEFIVQREYTILSYFANTPMWKESWQRFYRMIFRDSYKRLQRVSASLYDSFSKDISTDDFDKNITQVMLTWVQGFEYVRIPLGTDFVPLPAAISGSGSDCDSRALLLSVLMSHMGYKTMLFVSREYGHALFGIDIEGAGARMDSNGVSYLLGETTAPVSLGLVPQDMSEISKWIAIDGL